MFHVRRAAGSDVCALLSLCAQLGYPADAATVSRRFAAVEGDPHHAVLVAEGDDGRVIGWVHVMPRTTLLASHVAELGGLVVDDPEREKGVGAALVAHAERWARENGYRELVVRSDVRRDQAHTFYPALGFSPVKQQKVYRKSLR
jgi:N-acetylglutamate synthase-like GNAT family acetyltransferase